MLALRLLICGNFVFVASTGCTGVVASELNDKPSRDRSDVAEGGSAGASQTDSGTKFPRVTEGLIAFYTFTEGGNDVIYDRSLQADPLDLVVNPVTSTKWLSPGFSFIDPAIAATTGPAAKVINYCMGTNRLTVEAWVTPHDANQGDARIVTLSGGLSKRNFTLYQNRDNYSVGLLTSSSTDDGSPEVPSGAAVDTTKVSQVLFTFDGERLSLYVDANAKASSDEVHGDLQDWNLAHRLALGDELSSATSDSRPWLGDIYLVAIYDRALSTDEVRQNFNAGYRPD